MLTQDSSKQEREKLFKELSEDIIDPAARRALFQAVMAPDEDQENRRPTSNASEEIPEWVLAESIELAKENERRLSIYGLYRRPVTETVVETEPLDPSEPLDSVADYQEEPSYANAERPNDVPEETLRSICENRTISQLSAEIPMAEKEIEVPCKRQKLCPSDPKLSLHTDNDTSIVASRLGLGNAAITGESSDSCMKEPETSDVGLPDDNDGEIESSSKGKQPTPTGEEEKRQLEELAMEILGGGVLANPIYEPQEGDCLDAPGPLLYHDFKKPKIWWKCYPDTFKIFSHANRLDRLENSEASSQRDENLRLLCDKIVRRKGISDQHFVKAVFPSGRCHAPVKWQWKSKKVIGSEYQFPPELENGDYLNRFYTFYLVSTKQFSDFTVRLVVYLKLDEYRRAIDTRSPIVGLGYFLSKIKHYYEVATNVYFSDDQFRLTNCSHFDGVDPEDGFQLSLRQYQREALAFLKTVENDENYQRLAETESELYEPYVIFFDDKLPFYNLKTGLFCGKFPLEKPTGSLSCRGAILADATGTGKTVTALALIHSNPALPVNEIQLPAGYSPESFITSRASLVITPRNLAHQWIAEAKRVLPDIVVLDATTNSRLYCCSRDDIRNADMVVTTKEYLQSSYIQRSVKAITGRSRFDANNLMFPYNNEQSQLDTRDLLNRYVARTNMEHNVLLERFYWHRVVYDEFHEFSIYKGCRVSYVQNEFHGRSYLGITGTPQFRTTDQMFGMTKYLHFNAQNMSSRTLRNFLQRFVCRNEPELDLPPLTHNTIYVNLLPQELAMCNAAYGSMETSIMMCNHHQIAQEIVHVAGDQARDIKDVTALVQEDRRKEIAELELSMPKLKTTMLGLLRGVEHLLELDDDELSENEHEAREEYFTANHRYESAERRLSLLEAQLNFFETMISAVEGEQEFECPICMETIERGSKLALPQCGHPYCLECITMLLSRQPPKCATCRRDISSDKISKLMLKPKEVKMAPEQPEEECEPSTSAEVVPKVDPNEVDDSIYGSKIAHLINFLKETVEREDNAKIILFSQWRRLTFYISQCLKQSNIHFVRCCGSTEERSRQINSFKNDSRVRILMLSSEDSVSGLHLIEANHIVVTHPFHFRTELLSVAQEKQGIARAWRMGQTRPVTVTRFIARDTVEERIANNRGYRESMTIRKFAELEKALAPALATQ